MRATGLAIVGGLAAAAAMLPVSADAAVETRARPSAADAAARYWTEARIERARPLELVRPGPGEARLRTQRNHPFPFTSGEVIDPTVSPNATNGRLFGTLREVGPYSCSATVLDTANGRVVLTAGHCVYDPFVSRFAKRLLFVPAYTSGAAPFGEWSWTASETTREWVRHANSNFDYATVKLAKPGGVAVETAVGGRPLVTRSPRSQAYAAFGYPANSAAGERLWQCQSSYAGDDPRPFPLGAPPIAIGCDMTAGASGGGWITAAGGLASVSSFGYRAHPGILYGPYLGRKAGRLVRQAGAR